MSAKPEPASSLKLFDIRLRRELGSACADENPPVGLILCTQKDEAVARYALDGLPNKILATEYRTVLPDEQLIAAEIEKTRRQLEALRK